MSQTVPIFPLQTVLVPGGFLPLKIFEQRYLDMIRDCVRDDSGFGVCLILDGTEAGKAAHHACVGTLARIRDWNSLEGGLLGIVAQGLDRFTIDATRMRDNGLMIADVTTLPEAPRVEVPEAMHLLAEIVARFMDKLDANYPDFEKDKLQDASWVGYRLAELLPIRNLERQAMLEMHDPVERLESVLKILPRFQ
ncbi:MAG: LON peptidase substrate-binding domain-containing protein [Xanthomonadales bacterium]|nr:LON peptidase substrate-binding domain-containing protein [Xanthomonadales bacterium]NNL96456.1 LON peptidase substrate-binding domain-containing protein [Xanthomonadales bacterium]